jgi:hypothetical protein
MNAASFLNDLNRVGGMNERLAAMIADRYDLI